MKIINLDYLKPEMLMEAVEKIKIENKMNTISIGEDVIEAYEENDWLDNYTLGSGFTQFARITLTDQSVILDYEITGIQISLSD